MANTFFKFKRFSINQDKCAMKVGTDGVLLGAAADGGNNILDIGTGTGLVALMMAQRFPTATVTGIDIDDNAAAQAQENAAASPFADRITIKCANLSEFLSGTAFDCIVCNPPFFENALSCPNAKRAAARHTSSLPFSLLLSKISSLLTDDGCATLIVPTDSLARIEEECAYNNLFIVKRLFIKTVEHKPAKRVITTIRRHPAIAESVTHILTENGQRSTWYRNVCKEFYLDDGK